MDTGNLSRERPCNGRGLIRRELGRRADDWHHVPCWIRREFVAAQRMIKVEVEECASTSTKIDQVRMCLCSYLVS